MAKRKKTRYSDDYRAGCLALLEAAGYPDKRGALSMVHKKTGVPASTLAHWHRGTRNPVSPEMQSKKELDLRQIVRDEIAAIVPELSKTRPDTDYRTLITGLGILIDKDQLLGGKPTERAEVTFNDAAAAEQRLMDRMAIVVSRTPEAQAPERIGANGTGQGAP